MNPKKENEEIVLTEVSKVFQTGVFSKKVGVRDLTLTVPKGKIVGLLGPNGSGKSTSIKMILGFLKPTKGEISVCGFSPEQRVSRQFIGYLPENPRFQKFMTAEDILRYYGKLHDLWGAKLENRVNELLEKVGLNHARSERVQGFSKGMTQRLAIAQALLNEPRLLIFDEPMSGLDPIGRREIRLLIRKIHDELPDSTIFFSTHILSDVEELCDWVAVMRKGKLTTFCDIEALLKQDVEVYDIVFKPTSKDLNWLQASPSTTPLGTLISVNGLDRLLYQVDQLKKHNANIIGISSHRKNLEEALFLEKHTTETTHVAGETA